MWPPEAQSYLKVCGSEIPQNSKRAWGRRPLWLPPGRNFVCRATQSRTQSGAVGDRGAAPSSSPPQSRVHSCFLCSERNPQVSLLLGALETARVAAAVGRAGSSFQLSPSGPRRSRHWGLSTLFCEKFLQPFCAAQGPHQGMLLHQLNWNKTKRCSNHFSLSRAPQSQGSV